MKRNSAFPISFSDTIGSHLVVHSNLQSFSRPESIASGQVKSAQHIKKKEWHQLVKHDCFSLTLEGFICFGLGFTLNVGSTIKGMIININIQEKSFKRSKKHRDPCHHTSSSLTDLLQQFLLGSGTGIGFQTKLLLTAETSVYAISLVGHSVHVCSFFSEASCQVLGLDSEETRTGLQGLGVQQEIQA